MSKRGKVRCRRSWKAYIEWLFVGVLVLVSLSVYFVRESNTYRRLEPPSEGCTLIELASKLGEPRHLAFVVSDDKKRYVWLGRDHMLLGSGPPVYVFDDQGRLLEWSPDTGEGRKLDAIAREAFLAPRMTVAEAQEQMSKQSMQRKTES